MKEMPPGLLLAFCQLWAFALAYVPFEDVMVIDAVAIQSMAHTLKPGKKTFDECVVECLLEPWCVLFQFEAYKGTCKLQKDGLYYLNYVRANGISVGFLYSRAKLAYDMPHIDPFGGTQVIERGYASKNADRCFPFGAGYWLVTAAVSEKKSWRFKCYSTDRFSIMEYVGSRRSLIIPRIKTTGSCVVAGVDHKQVGCQTYYVDEKTAYDCEYECNVVEAARCVSWKLFGSFGRCHVYFSCVSPPLEFTIDTGGNYISGFRPVNGVCPKLPGVWIIEDFLFTWVPNYEGCREKCAENWRCRQFTFINYNTCRYGGGTYALIGYDKESTTVMIPPSEEYTIRAEPCVFKGITATGAKTVAVATQRTVFDCWTFCLRKMECTWISLLDVPIRHGSAKVGQQNDCRVTYGGTVVFTFLETAASATLREADGSCSIPGVKINGNPLQPPIQGITTDGGCKTECKNRSKVSGDCYSYTWDISTCSLYGLNHNKVGPAGPNVRSGQIRF